MHDQLLTEQRETTLWITLNRADKANALAVGMTEGAAAAFRDAATNDAVRAIVLTGAGDRAFCAGIGVREPPLDGDAASHRKLRSVALAALIDAIVDTPKPLVQSGRRMPAAEALARGLLNRVVSRGELDAAAAQVAAELAGKDPMAFAANKLWLNRRVKRVLAEARAEHERHRKA